MSNLITTTHAKSGNRPTIKALLILAAVLFVGFSQISLVRASPIELSSCGNIALPGSYTLTDNVTSTQTCFSISANDVELDCRGYTIAYNTDGVSTRMGIDAISGTNPRTNLTIRNCIIIKPTDLQTAGYGIRLTRFSNSRIINNTIYTNGTTNNYGIYLTTNSLNNTLEGNTIYSSGTSTGNTGIYLLSNSGNNTIRNNYISTYGTTTSYGIWIATNSHGNLIENNTISTYGSAPSTTTSSYGIYVNNLVNGTIIRHNNISTDGRNENYGVYLLTNVFKSQIYNNTIRTAGTQSSNIGIVIAATTTAFAEEN